MPNNVAIRLSVEGGAELRRNLDDAGRAGQDAFRGIGAAADQASTATDKLTQRSQQAAQAARAAQSAGGPTSMPSPAPATSREAERIRSQLDEEYRKRAQAERAGRLISQGEASGQFTPAYADRLRTLSDRKYGPQNDNTREGLSSYDRLFVKYQAIDSAQQLASGALPGLVALQQGGQVFQQLGDREGGLSAGLKQLGVSAAALVTPFSVALVAATALGGGFLYAGVSAGQQQDAMERATKGLGAATGATAGQLDALARANAEAGKVSTSTARDMVASYNSTGQIGTGVFGTLIQSTERYARLTGQDTTAATQELARAFGDLTTGADAIAAKIGGLDDKTRQLILTQIEQGDRAAAQVTAGEYLKSTVDANSTSTTGWAAAWDRAKAAADGYWEAAKRIAGIKLGVAPEGATEAVERLRKEVDGVNNNRRGIGMAPLDPEFNSQARDLQVAEGRANQERLIAEANAARERAASLSRTAGNLARGSDPNFARLSQLNTETSDLRDALSDPFTRGRMSPDTLAQTTDAYIARLRAIESLTDGNNKLISSEEMSRRQDQLRLDAVNATTAAEKADVAVRQKRLDLMGKSITPSDAASQIDMARRLALANASSGGGRSSDSLDDYDRATKSLDDRVRRQGEEATTYGMAAEAVARYRAEQDLLVAAKRAERDLTPTLLKDIKEHADAAGDAAKRVEDARESSRRSDEYRSVGSDGVRTLVRDLADGAKAGKILDDVLGSLKNRMADLAATSISDALFGRRGSGDSGALGGLLSGLFRPDSASTAAASASNGSGLFSSLRSLLGFAEGGFTGFADRGAIAGFVHGREYVFDAEATHRIGVSNLDAMRRGVRGYSDGGFVGAKAFAGSGGNSDRTPTINFLPPAGVALEPDGPPQRRADGSFDQALKLVGKGLAGEAAKGRGPFQQAVGGPGFRKG